MALSIIVILAILSLFLVAGLGGTLPGFIIIALLSLIVIFWSAEYLLLAISNYSKKTGLSHYIIGFLIVAMGTSLPELSTGIMSAVAKNNVLSLGNVIGANILDVTLILGIIFIITGRMKNTENILSKSMISFYLVILLPLLLGIDGNISRIDGLILIIVFVLYLISLLRKEHSFGNIKKNVKFDLIIIDMVTFLFALVALLLTSRFFSSKLLL